MSRHSFDVVGPRVSRRIRPVLVAGGEVNDPSRSDRIVVEESDHRPVTGDRGWPPPVVRSQLFALYNTPNRRGLEDTHQAVAGHGGSGRLRAERLRESGPGY
jgi:hypothetical protein